MRQPQPRCLPQGYLKISHATRLNCIYLNKVHGLLPPSVARETGIPANSVRNFLKAYDLTGRTNKKSTLKANTEKAPETQSLRQ